MSAWKFSANLSLMYTHLPFEKRMEAAKLDGFNYVECQFPYTTNANVLKDTLSNEGLQMVLINAPAGNWEKGERGIASLAGREDEFKQGAEQAIQYAKTIGCKLIHVLAGCMNIDGNDMHDIQNGYDRAFESYLKNLDWLAEEFKNEELTWLIEPINNRDFPNYLINTQAQAHAVVHSLEKNNIGVQMDLYHCQIMEGDIEFKLREYLKTNRVKHIQISSVPLRVEPDVGELNYAHLLDILNSEGYQGYVGCEYKAAEHTSKGVARWRNNMPEWIKEHF